MKYTFTRKQIVNAFNNKILDDDNFLTYLLSTTSKDIPMNQNTKHNKKQNIVVDIDVLHTGSKPNIYRDIDRKFKKDKISSKRQCESCKQFGKGTCNAFKCIARNYCDWEEIKRPKFNQAHWNYPDETETIIIGEPKELDWCWQKEFLSSGSMNGCGDLSIMISTVSNILTQQRTELFNDLIKIADSGEFEDMRRELNIYFKGKDE